MKELDSILIEEAITQMAMDSYKELHETIRKAGFDVRRQVNGELALFRLDEKKVTGKGGVGGNGHEKEGG